MTTIMVTRTKPTGGHTLATPGPDTATTLLREARLRAGWGQVRLARALHISRSALSMYEIGARAMPPELRRRAAQVLRAPEVLLQSDETPLRGHVLPGTLAELSGWLREELAEALKAAERLEEAARKRHWGEDVEHQLFDLYTALDSYFAARARAGLDLETLRRAHEEKLRKRGYLRCGHQKT